MKSRPDLLTALTLACLVTPLASCGSGGLPETHYYTLGPPREALDPAVSEREEGLTIGVESFAVDPPYDQDRIVYRLSPEATEVGYYHYHRWAAPLGRLVQNAFVGGLRDSPGIASIEPASSSGNYGARLGGRILYLEQIDRPSGGDVRVALELELSEESGRLWSTTLAGTKSGEMIEGSDVATLLARLIGEIVDDARREISAALPSE